MTKDDLTYYQHRAEAEVEQAQKASLHKVVSAHYEMANAYLDRVEELKQAGVLENG